MGTSAVWLFACFINFEITQTLAKKTDVFFWE